MAQQKRRKGDDPEEPIELDDEPDLDPQIYALKERLDKVQGGISGLSAPERSGSPRACTRRSDDRAAPGSPPRS